MLEQLVADGAIDGSKAEAAKAKYIAIHDALVTTMSNEQSLLEKAKGLKSQLDVSAASGWERIALSDRAPPSL